MNGKNSMDDIAIWKAMVEITQIPAKPQKEDSWLFYIPNHNYPIGLEIFGDNKLTWRYFTKADDLEGAKAISYQMLGLLRQRFPSINGVVKIRPIKNREIKEDFYKDDREEYFQLEFPAIRYRSKINLIQNFINQFNNKNKGTIYLSLLWERITSIDKSMMNYLKEHKMADNLLLNELSFYPDGEIPRDVQNFVNNYTNLWGLDGYKLKIFYGYELRDAELKNLEIENSLKSLCIGIENERYHNAKSSFIHKYDMIMQLLRVHPFEKGKFNVISPKMVDFNFPKNTPLQKGYVLENENIVYTNPLMDGTVILGNHVSNGVPTEHEGVIFQKILNQHCLICGTVNTGKTLFSSFVINQIENSGVLIFNLFKPKQEGMYNVDVIYRYGDEDFETPYCPPLINPLNKEKIIEETGEMYVACLGLRDVFEEIIYSVKQFYLELKYELPQEIMELFDAVKEYLIENPYDKEVQTNFLTAFENRIKPLRRNRILQNTLRLRKSIPKWYKDLQNGKKVYIDLSMCSKYEQRFIVSAMFQLIRTLSSGIETKDLRMLIVVDEAHRIFHKPRTQNPDHHRFIRQEMFEMVFSEMMKALRSAGVGVMVIDHESYRLFECIVELTGLKILFRMGERGAELFSKNKNEQSILTQQKNREALILNRTTSEKYQIKTIDIELSERIKFRKTREKTKVTVIE